MSPNPQLEVAAQVLALVRAGGGDPEAEVTVERQALALTRFANSFIHQNLADDTTTVHLRLHAGGRTATGATTRIPTASLASGARSDALTGPDGLRELVARTGEAVRHAPSDPGWPGLAPPAPLAGAAGFDEPTAAAEPAERAQRVREFVDAAGGLETAGYCRTVLWSTAFANSAGQAVTGQTSEAAMDGIARIGGSDGVAKRTSVSLSDLDGARLGGRAAAKARAGVDPVELPPGRYEVVLEPTAVADLLANLAIWGFNGKALAERRTFAEPGVAQFDPSITLVDDPFADRSPGRSFDGEGTPKRRLVLVDAGTTETVVHDRRTAALVGDGATTTGHAVPGGGSSWGAFPLNLGLEPGARQGAAGRGEATAGGGLSAAGRGEATAGGGLSPAPAEPMVVAPGAAGLVGQVERGLLVTDLWYTRVLDPRTLVMTGLTRNGVWLIEDGKVAAPVQNLRFTQSYPQALAPGAVKGVGPSTTMLLTGLTSSWLRAPALHLAAWNFTGGASG